jgi:hypothetical protein
MANTFECSRVSCRIAERERHGNFSTPQLILYMLVLSGVTPYAHKQSMTETVLTHGCAPISEYHQQKFHRKIG